MRNAMTRFDTYHQLEARTGIIAEEPLSWLKQGILAVV
jgi:hypothetical protein